MRIAILCAAALPLFGQPVRTTGGLVTGAPGRDPTITAYKGIPFAAPPVGNLRWREPQPPTSWDGVRPATSFSPSCVQNIFEEKKPWTHEFMAHGAVSEDCLYLNVWTGAKSVSEKRPVFVWIYGGAFMEGSASVALYDGEGLASKGLVVVTFNYRVNAFGFLAHPELTRESPHGASGNYGLLDQIAALRWVRENIAAFGGDPYRVTLAGQSAGSMSVHALLGSPLAKGLFHRAIAQSGLGSAGAALTDAEQAGLRFQAVAGAASIAEMRAMKADRVLATIGTMRFAPIRDGHLVPEEPLDSDVPVLAGLTQDDLGAMRNPTPLYKWAFQRQAKTFTYYWKHPLPGPDAAQYGAFHSSELPYVLNTLYASDRPFTETDRRIADDVSSIWVRFATTGDPGWPGVSPPDTGIMELGDAIQRGTMILDPMN